MRAREERERERATEAGIVVEIVGIFNSALFIGGGGGEEGVVATERHQRGSLRKNAFLLSGVPIASMDRWLLAWRPTGAAR